MTGGGRGKSGPSASEALLQAADPDRAVALAFAPDAKRPALAALHALDREIAGIRDHVSQPLPGEIRLQWWRDRIARASAGEAAGQPVADEVLAAIRAFDLPVEPLDRLCEARIFDLYDDPMPDRRAFEAYAGDTASALMMLGAMILDREAAPALAEPAGHGGVALAAVEAIRALPRHRRRGSLPFPVDLMAAAGASAERVLAGDAEAGRRAVLAMADFAEVHWRSFAAHRKRVTKATRPAFLPLYLVPAQLAAIRAEPAACLERPAGVGAIRRLARYWTAMRE